MKGDCGALTIREEVMLTTAGNAGLKIGAKPMAFEGADTPPPPAAAWFMYTGT